MFEALLNRDALGHVDHQHSAEQIFEGVGEFGMLREFVLLGPNQTEDFLLRVAIKRHHAGHSLEEDDAQGPDITLLPVNAGKDLRRNIIRGATHLASLILVLKGDRGSKVDQLDLS